MISWSDQIIHSSQLLQILQSYQMQIKIYSKMKACAKSSVQNKCSSCFASLWSTVMKAAFVLIIFITLVPAYVCASVVGLEPVDNFSQIHNLDENRVTRHVYPKTTSQSHLPPSFDAGTPTNITVTASTTALLPCVVNNIANKSVSWIRHRDLHILSVGEATYTNDDRFKVVPPSDTNEGWTLRIQYAHERDSGQYDCQVSSRPTIGRTVHLTVIEPRARLVRGPEMFVGAGSLINLTCLVSYSPEAPEYLYWYHKERMVREDGSRIFIKTQLGTKSASELIVTTATESDSGIYTCSPAHSREYSITVHVVTDGHPAAMQGGSSVTSVGHRKLLWLMTIPMFIVLVDSYKTYFFM